MIETKSKVIVKLISHTGTDPLDLTSHAAKICYQSEEPEWGKRIDAENILFKTGHHTTFQHFFLTFMIDGISVGDITLGMHLASPFYNSNQRSGRYASKMFLEPNFKKIESYITNYWPDLETGQKQEVMEYIKSSVGIYHKNIAQATETARKIIKEERPFIPEKSLQISAPKVAQEQMRAFIPVIFPTSMDFTINITALSAMYRSAWSPAMKSITKQMVDSVIEKFPELAFVFDKEQRADEWSPEFLKSKNEILDGPKLKLLNIEGEENFVNPYSEIMHPVDLLHFRPESMTNNIGTIKTEIVLSLATMGQEQRHRTLRRGAPSFTGDFYLPAIPRECGLEESAKTVLAEWLELSKKIPKTLAAVIAPYGATVIYTKEGSFNAIAHEQGKRLCFLAQEEIYNLGRIMREEIEKEKGKDCPLLSMLEPPCYRDGKCAEGNRYCGRDMKLRKTRDYFPRRKI